MGSAAYAQGRSSSRGLCRCPLTRRVRTSVRWACGSTLLILQVAISKAEDRPVLGAALGPREQVIFSAQVRRADGAFDRVAVASPNWLLDLDAAGVQGSVQSCPVVESAADRLGEVALLAEQVQAGRKSGFEGLQDLRVLLLPDGSAFFG